MGFTIVLDKLRF